MTAFLVPVDPNQMLIPLDKAVVLIGRQADCDVSLTHSRKISRKHCCIAHVNDRFMVRDLGSTNGVFVNGNRIDKEAFIAMGDALIIGDVQFQVQSEAPVVTNRKPTKLGEDSAKAPQPANTSKSPPPIPVRPRKQQTHEASENENDPIADATLAANQSIHGRTRVDDVIPLDADDNDDDEPLEESLQLAKD